MAASTPRDLQIKTDFVPSFDYPAEKGELEGLSQFTFAVMETIGDISIILELGRRD